MPSKTKSYPIRFKEEDGIIVPSGKANHVVDTTYVKRYHSFIYILFGIKGCARDLVEFLQFDANDELRVSNNEDTRERFNNALRKANMLPYSESMVNKSFETLCRKNILIRLKGRGVYLINADYIWKRKEDERLEYIEAVLRFRESGDTIHISKQ